MCLRVYFCSVGIFFLGYNCVNKSAPTRTQQWTRHGTHCHLGCPTVRLAHIPTVWCSTVLHGATCCAGMHCHYAGGRLCCIIQVVLVHTATVRCGTHCHGVLWYCVARTATVYFNLVLCGTWCHGVLWHALPLCCVWHALPTSRVTHAVRGLRQVLLLLFCVCNTPLFYYLLHSCLSGM